MSYLPYVFPKLFVGNGTIATTGTSENLAANAIGLFDANTGAVVTTGNASTHPYVILAVGSDYTVGNIGKSALGGLQLSRKTQGINAKYVSRFYKTVSRAAANHVLNVGWSRLGTDTTGPKFETNHTYNLRVEAKGTPVLHVINRNYYVHAPFFTGCVVDPNHVGLEYADAALVMKGFADYINNDPIASLFVIATPYYRVANTTATTNSTTTLTVASGTGIAVGQTISGAGIPVGTTVSAVSGTTVTMSAAATASASGVAVAFSKTVDGTYTSPADQTSIAAVVAGVELSYGYVDTVFGDCSFAPTDFYQKEPIIGGVSLVDDKGDPCTYGPQIDSAQGIFVATKQAPVIAKGLGESVIREYIQSREYEQIHFNRDARKREIEADPVFTTVDRTAKYTRYYLKFHVPVFNNFSNTFTQNTYLICFAFKSTVDASAFETLITGWLSGNGSAVALETIV